MRSVSRSLVLRTEDVSSHRILIPLTILACSTIFACGEDATEPPPPPPPPTVASVEVTPASGTLISLDETLQLTATAHDAGGSAMTGVSFTWSSDDVSCASVGTSGTVTAVGNGTATITATASGISGSASITVAQALATVGVTPASATLTAIGETTQLTASAQDANGNAISGPTFSWESSDESVAAVSTDGLVTGVKNGAATITATTDGVSGDATVTVAAPEGPIGLYSFEGGSTNNAVTGEGALPDLVSSGCDIVAGDAVFDSGADYLELPVALGTSPFTIWIDATYAQSAGHSVIMGQGLPAASGPQDADFNVVQFVILGVSPNRLRTVFWGSGGEFNSIDTGIGLMDGSRRRIAITWDGSGMGAFFDGSLLTKTTIGWPDIDGTAVRFGASQFGSGAASLGRIHEIRVYGWALAEEELNGLGEGS